MMPFPPSPAPPSVHSPAPHRHSPDSPATHLCAAGVLWEQARSGGADAEEARAERVRDGAGQGGADAGVRGRREAHQHHEDPHDAAQAGCQADAGAWETKYTPHANPRHVAGSSRRAGGAGGAKTPTRNGSLPRPRLDAAGTRGGDRVGVWHVSMSPCRPSNSPARTGRPLETKEASACMHSPLVRVRVPAVLQSEPTGPSSISLIHVTRLGPPLETLSSPAVSTSHPPPHW